MMPWHVVDRLVDAPARHGHVLVLKHRGENHQEQDRQGQGEEHGLPVAEKTAQVGPILVPHQPDERGARMADPRLR